MKCGYCEGEDGRHQADCPELGYVKFEELEPVALEAWARSMRACAGSTSYEDYLARLAAEYGVN